MSHPAQILRDFKPSKEFFIGIDSDGCVFDSMEIKHKECFAPMFIKHFGLQAVSKYAREVWEFVNLYSKTRGANRFPALSRSLSLLKARPQVIAHPANARFTAPFAGFDRNVLPIIQVHNQTLHGISSRRHIAASTRPVRVKEFTARFVETFVRVRSEIIPLRLKQIRGQALRAIRIIKRQRG